MSTPNVVEAIVEVVYEKTVVLEIDTGRRGPQGEAGQHFIVDATPTEIADAPDGTLFLTTI